MDQRIGYGSPGSHRWCNIKSARLILKWENRLVLDVSLSYIGIAWICISQLYDQVLTTDIVVQNRGKVAMDFTVSGAARESNCTPGQIVVSPATVSETPKLLFCVS